MVLLALVVARRLVVMSCGWKPWSTSGTLTASDVRSGFMHVNAMYIDIITLS